MTEAAVSSTRRPTVPRMDAIERPRRNAISPLRPSEALAVLVGMIALTMAWFWNAWVSPTTSQVGNQTDPNLFQWFLAWVPFAIGHGHNPLVTHFVNYPNSVNLMWNTSMPLAGLLLSPITVTAGPVVSYNVLVTLGPSLSGWCAYLAFRRYANLRPALAGGLLFGFGTFMTAEVSSHPHLIILASAPLFLILFDRLLVRQDAPAWRIGALIGVVAGAQLLLGEEILMIEALAIIIGVLVLAVSSPEEIRQRASYSVRGLGVALGVFLIIGGWPLAVQFLGPARVTAPVQSGNIFVADLASFVVPTRLLHFSPASAIAASNHFTGSVFEWGSYLGVPMLALLAITAWTVRRRLTLVAFAVGGALALLSLGPRLHLDGHVTSIRLPWSLIDHLPLFSHVLPVRLAFGVLLMVALLVVVFLDRLESAGLWARLAGWALVLTSFLALLPNVPYSTTNVHSHVAFGRQLVCSATGQQRPAILVLPMVDEEMMRWQQQADFCFTTPGGTFFSGDTIPTTQGRVAAWGPAPLPPLGVASSAAENGLPLPPVTPALQASVRRELNQPVVTEVAVGPMDGHDRLVSWITSVLGVPPRQIVDTDVWLLAR